MCVCVLLNFSTSCACCGTAGLSHGTSPLEALRAMRTQLYSQPCAYRLRLLPLFSAKDLRTESDSTQAVSY